MDKKIIIMLSVVMLLASPMAAYAYDTNDPAKVDVVYVANVDTSFSVAGGSIMTFNATKHCLNVPGDCSGGNPRNAKLVEPDNQNASNDDEYLTITNGATISQDFSAALNATVTGIQTKLGGTSDHTSAKNIGTIPTVILNNIAGGHSGRIFGWANFSAAPVGSTSRQITLSSSEALEVTTIVVSPNPGSVTVGNYLDFNAVAYDQYGTSMPGETSFVWGVASGNGTIDPTGNYSTSGAYAGDVATVRAAIGSISGTATVNVRAPPILTGIVIGIGDSIVETSATTTLTAIGLDQNGIEMPIPTTVTLTWSTDIGSIAPSTGVTTTFTAPGSVSGGGDASATIHLVATGSFTSPIPDNSLIVHTV